MRPFILFSACLLSGCIPPGRGRTPDPESKHVLLEVPFYPNHSDQCGPSALTSVLDFWGKTGEHGQLKEEIYRAELKGSLSVDLLLAAQSHGMSAEILDGGLPQLKKELDAGHPLIVFINRGFRLIPIGHYMVVTGYDDRLQGIYAHSGTKQNELISYRRFSRPWERTERWTLLILPASP